MNCLKRIERLVRCEACANKKLLMKRTKENLGEFGNWDFKGYFFLQVLVPSFLFGLLHAQNNILQSSLFSTLIFIYLLHIKAANACKRTLLILQYLLNLACQTIILFASASFVFILHNSLCFFSWSLLLDIYVYMCVCESVKSYLNNYRFLMH